MNATRERNRCKYVVLVNMPGYMPDSDPEHYATKRDAQAALKWHADQFREMGDINERGKWVSDYRVTGSADAMWYEAINRYSQYGAGYVIYADYVDCGPDWCDENCPCRQDN